MKCRLSQNYIFLTKPKRRVNLHKYRDSLAKPSNRRTTLCKHCMTLANQRMNLGLYAADFASVVDYWLNSRYFYIRLRYLANVDDQS